MRTDTGLIYFVQMGHDGPIKIGRAKSKAALATRMSTIQISCVDPIFLLAVLPGDGPKEAELHNEFDDARLRGEWFRPDRRMLEFIDKIGAPDGFPRTTRQKLEARMSVDEARAVWMDATLSVHAAISRMPGWHVKSAIAEIGRRPERAPEMYMNIEKQREYGRKGGQVAKSRSTRIAWETRAYAPRRKAAAVTWRDPAHDDWEQARAALPEDLRRMSFTTLWRLLGPRNPKAKGRGRPRSTS